MLKSLIKAIIVAIKKKKLEKLTNDPKYQALLKRYNIEPVPWDKDFKFSDLPAFRKKKSQIKMNRRNINLKPHSE